MWIPCGSDPSSAQLCRLLVPALFGCASRFVCTAAATYQGRRVNIASHLVTLSACKGKEGKIRVFGAATWAARKSKAVQEGALNNPKWLPPWSGLAHRRGMGCFGAGIPEGPSWEGRREEQHVVCSGKILRWNWFLLMLVPLLV